MNIDIFKKYEIVQVENKDTYFFFKTFFKTIYKAQTNMDAIHLCKIYNVSIVFLYCNRDTIDTKKAIHALKAHKPDIVIVVISYFKTAAKLVPLLHLGITDHFNAVQDMHRTEKTLKNIYNSLHHLEDNMVFLHEDYCFDTHTNVLYNKDIKAIKLSKKELDALKLFIIHLNQYISVDELEYTLWPEDYYCENCRNRLKNLIYRLKKKLPDGSLINTYEIGYKLVGSKPLSTSN